MTNCMVKTGTGSSRICKEPDLLYKSGKIRLRSDFSKANPVQPYCGRQASAVAMCYVSTGSIGECLGFNINIEWRWIWLTDDDISFKQEER